MKKFLKKFTPALIAASLFGVVPAYAAPADMAQSIWNDVYGQIKQVVNNVVLPIVIVALLVLFVVKTATTYSEYRKSGHLEWTAPALLFVGLCIAIAAKTYMWLVVPA